MLDGVLSGFNRLIGVVGQATSFGWTCGTFAGERNDQNGPLPGLLAGA